MDTGVKTSPSSSIDEEKDVINKKWERGEELVLEDRTQDEALGWVAIRTVTMVRNGPQDGHRATN